MISAASLSVVGLLMNLVGIILLFRYGMPFRVRTDGNQIRWLTGLKNAQIARIERMYSVLGWIGMVLIILGTTSQICGVLRGA